jgi:hypothetical protein
MATESVKILIEAEDKASAQIVAATKKIEGTVKATKDLTKNAKSSTEMFGSLAGALGGTEIGSFANQIGGLTGKLGEFSEIQKAGGAGSLAFKAGLVGVAGVIGFQLGNALGNAIFQTEKWKQELTEATAEAKRLSDVASKMRSLRFSDEKTDIEIIRDPEKKQKQYEDLLARVKSELKGASIEAIKADAVLKAYNDTYISYLKGADALLKSTADDKKKIAQDLQTQKEELERILGIEKEREKSRKVNIDRDYLQSLDKQLAMLQAIKKDSQIDFGNVSNIEQLQQEIKLLEQQKGGIEALREQAKQSTSGIVVQDVAATLSEEDKKKKDEVEKQLQFANKRIAELTKKKSLATSKEDVSFLAEGLAMYEKERDTLQQINQQLAARATGAVVGIDGTKEAESKLVAIKLLEKQTELERLQREEKKAAIKEIADAEFAATMAAEKAFMAERDRLEEQKVLLNQGAEAAHAMRLAKQGLSEEDAKSFAKQQTELDNQKQVQERMKARESAAPLQAISSRFLTRGPVDDKMLDVAKTQLKVQQEQLVELKKKPQAPVVRDLRLVEVG